MAGVADFRHDVRSNARISDLLALASVPILLTLVFLLPAGTRNALILNHENYSILTLWSSAVVHRGFEHFVTNVVAYCVLIGPIYLLFALAGERTLFRYTFLSVLLLLPPVISLATVIAFGGGTSAGFSGIGAAFFGLLPVSICLFLHNEVSASFEPTHGVGLFLIATGFIALIYAGPLPAAGILFIALFLTIVSIYRMGPDEGRNALGELVSMTGYFELVLISGLLFLLSPFLLFPQEIVHDGGTVNILSHFFGFSLGFLGPTIYLMFRSD